MDLRRLRALRPHEVLTILLVLIAPELQQLCVRVVEQLRRHRPGSREGVWIVDRHLQIDMSEVTAAISFRDSKRFGMRVRRAPDE
jgi:hypothetical protein